MGYETRYELDWSPRSKETDEAIAAYIKDHPTMRYALTPDGSARTTCKWYSHLDDTTTLSEKFPGVTFHLYGEGEGAGDIWDAYALDGKVQKQEATVTRVMSPDPEAWK